MRNLVKRIEALSALVFTVILSIGSWAEFALPYYRGGPLPAGCFFGDHLIVFISCDASIPGWMEQIVSWAWYLTWGWFWLAAFFVPFTPAIGVPLAILWLAVSILAARWLWRNAAGHFNKRSRPM